MSGEISRWNELLASGLAATEKTLVLFTPYALITSSNAGTLAHGATDHIMFYSGPSVLQQELPSNRNLTRVHLAVGELIVPTVRLIPRALVVPRSAIALGLVGPTEENNPLGRTHEFACVRTCDLPRIVLQRGIPRQRLPTEDATKEVPIA